MRDAAKLVADLTADRKARDHPPVCDRDLVRLCFRWISWRSTPKSAGNQEGNDDRVLRRWLTPTFFMVSVKSVATVIPLHTAAQPSAATALDAPERIVLCESPRSGSRAPRHWTRIDHLQLCRAAFPRDSTRARVRSH